MDTQKVEGIISDIKEKNGRYSITIGDKKYATFDAEIGNKLKINQKVKVEYMDKESVGITYHNIKHLEIMTSQPPIIDGDRRKYRAMCLSYVKDMVIAGNVEIKSMLRLAGELFEWINKT